MIPPPSLELARQHHRANRLAEAEAIYREILAADPQSADAWHFLGVIAGQTGRHEEAVAHLRQAVALKPEHAEAHKNLGVALKASGREDEALAAYRQAVAIKPDYAEAHKNLANLLLAKGATDEAIEAYRDAVVAWPDFAEAWSNLGAALRRNGQFDEAVAAGRKAIAIMPTHAEAHSNLGNALLSLGNLDAAIESYRTAVQLAPTFAAAWNNLGIALMAKSQTTDAVTAYEQAVQLRPEYADALANLGHALKEQGRTADAIAAYRRATALKPHSPDWQHVLAALSGDSAPTSTPASYVRNLFESYAGDFDVHLTGPLEYRVPELLLDAVRRAAPGRSFEILDLGCGTGLCGAQFPAIASRLVGVDLAPAMLAKAAERKIYDELVCADISVAMNARAGAFDLILSGDLFVYVGDLGDAFRSAARALRDRGLFGFSLERHDGEGFVLTSKVRFAHSLAYIRDLSRRSGFAELLVREIVVRKSGRDDISGYLVLLQKSIG